MKCLYPLVAIAVSSPTFASETRQLDAHVHGVGALNIAFDGRTIAMELHAPGADIVGFEHAAENAEDRAAIETAVATLARPLDLFVLPDAAQCTVTQASAMLESDAPDSHDDHAEADGHDHDHEDHTDADGHDHDHEHEDHADADGHDHEDHADAHDHDDHADDHAGHSEFHAEYMFDCAQPDKIAEISFAYFAQFENARELAVQIVTSSGANAFEVERDAPTLDLRGMF